MTTSKKKGVWGFDLEYPNLECARIGHDDFPVVWYVITEGCNSGLAPLPPQENAHNLHADFAGSYTLVNEQTTVYPNPFEDYFIVESTVDDQLTVQTLDGKTVGIYPIKQGENKILLKENPNGVYICTLKQQVLTFKLIKR